MGGVSNIVKDIGKFFNSDIGRVLTAIPTGGMSEVGRFAAKQAVKRLDVDPDLAAAGGALLGGAGAASLGLSKPIVAAGPNVAADVATVPVTATASLARTATDAEARERARAETALAEADAARTKREADLAARTETPQEADAARRRARISADRLGQGRRRASQVLTTPALGGY